MNEDDFVFLLGNKLYSVASIVSIICYHITPPLREAKCQKAIYMNVQQKFQAKRNILLK